MEHLLPSSCASYFTLADLECNICTQILDGPVELPCGNIVCANCLCEKLDQKREMVCPCCPTEYLLEHTHITPANTLVQKVLSNLTVICIECGGLVKASAMEKHAEAKCQTHTIPISPSRHMYTIHKRWQPTDEILLNYIVYVSTYHGKSALKKIRID